MFLLQIQSNPAHHHIELFLEVGLFVLVDYYLHIAGFEIVIQYHIFDRKMTNCPIESMLYELIISKSIRFFYFNKSRDY